MRKKSEKQPRMTIMSILSRTNKWRNYGVNEIFYDMYE